MKSLQVIGLFLGILASTAACLKVKTYPDKPQIELLSLQDPVGDTNMVEAIIHFTDGDGDIGLDDTDNQPPFDTASKYYNNLLLKYYIKTGDGTWFERASFGYRIKRITPTGKIKVLEGEIELDAFVLDSVNPHSAKYSFQLIDRSLNESNIVESDVFKVEP